jgi:hypothetical protein
MVYNIAFIYSEDTCMELKILPDGRMSSADAAAYLGLSKPALAARRARGMAPQFTKVGRSKVFYYKADLDAFIGQPMRSVAEARDRERDLARERVG